MGAHGREVALTRRMLGVTLGLAVAVAVASAPRPEGLSAEAWRVAAIALLMATWWMFDVLPRAVTALLPLVAFPVLGVLPMAEVARGYAHPLLFLMLGGFVIGHAMERVGLHLRLTALVLRPAWVRAGPRRVLAVLMAVAAGMSGIVSNTATVLMMLPLALALARACGAGARAEGAFVLALAYASSVGGMATIVGTPPNAVLAGVTPALLGVEIGFARWMLIGVPTALLLLPVAWWSVAVVTWRLPRRFDAPVAPPELPAPHPGERTVIAVTGAALGLWITRGDLALGALTLPGWERLVPARGLELDAGVALLAAMTLFVAPGERVEGVRRPLLCWHEAERAVPWSVILLLGGGFALADAIAASGVTGWLAGFASGLAGLPIALKVLAICLGVTFLTELTSNTATAQIALPILAEAAPVAGLAPLAWMVPATLSASCAFMLPVATAPNAIASEAGGVRGAEMARAGLVLNVLAALVVTLVGVTLVPWVLGP